MCMEVLASVFLSFGGAPRRQPQFVEFQAQSLPGDTQQQCPGRFGICSFSA